MRNRLHSRDDPTPNADPANSSRTATTAGRFRGSNHAPVHYSQTDLQDSYA